MLSEILAYNWRSLAARGLLSLIFGILVLAMPGPALLGLVFAFGVYSILDGIFAITTGFRRHRVQMERWGVPIVLGVLSIAAGIIAFAYPGITAFALAIIIGIWATAIGFLELVIATNLRKLVPGEGYLVFSGILSIVWGLVMFALPAAGAISLVVLIGAVSVVNGLFRMSAAWKLRHEWKLISAEQKRELAA